VAVGGRALRQRASDHRIRIVAEQLDAQRGRPDVARAVPTVFLRLTDKKGAPPTSSPATEPRRHNSFAPSARLYHSTAFGASGTASMSDRIGPQ
jgi:hypothetical protein